MRDGDEPWGDCLDMFTYTVRDAEIRLFVIGDIGNIGDLNLDGTVNMMDLQTVTNNMGRSGDLDVEDGDANADGTVNTSDADIVVEELPD